MKKNNVSGRLLLCIVTVASLLAAMANGAEYLTDIDNLETDVTLFRGAANNTYYEVYFNAKPEPGAERVVKETRFIDLRPERDVTLHVEIFNPTAQIPLIVTPGGNGDTQGFGGFARNIAAAAPDLKVIVYDRRNLGLSQVNFGSAPQMIEEGEDLHVLIERLGVAPVALYGMSSGGRSNMYLASRYPQDIAALTIAPMTGAELAATRLSEDYFLKYLHDEKLSSREHETAAPIESMQDLAATPLWSAYLERNSAANRQRFFDANIVDFLRAMKTSATHLQQTRSQVALGMQDTQLAQLQIPATLILHHGSYRDFLHPITNTRAATTLIENSTYEFAPYLPEILAALLPFVRKHTPRKSD